MLCRKMRKSKKNTKDISKNDIFFKKNAKNVFSKIDQDVNF